MEVRGSQGELLGLTTTCVTPHTRLSVLTYWSQSKMAAIDAHQNVSNSCEEDGVVEMQPLVYHRPLTRLPWVPLVVASFVREILCDGVTATATTSSYLESYQPLISVITDLPVE